jgi:hypothetical protein
MKPKPVPSNDWLAKHTAEKAERETKPRPRRPWTSRTKPAPQEASVQPTEGPQTNQDDVDKGN